MIDEMLAGFPAFDHTVHQNGADEISFEKIRLRHQGSKAFRIRQHQLTGATVINVLQRATVLTLAQGKNELSNALLQRCIRDEQYK